MSSLLGRFAATRTTEAPEAHLWADGGLPNVMPSESLAVLAAHRSDPTRSWLDRVGHFVFTTLRRSHRVVASRRQPVVVMRKRAEAVLAAAERHRSVEESALRAHLSGLAAACRVTGNTETRVATTMCAIDAGLSGVVLAVERTQGFTPHVEQIMAVLALLDGRMVEMATGEGKTLTAAMAAVIAAWRGRPCHVVTANDYLARRDAELGQALFALCGVSAASVDGESPAPARAAAYRHDIVYCTAKELLGDHLRDGLILGKTPSAARFALKAARSEGRSGTGGIVLRGIFQVIVDEADSVLIDEAVTPLIIAAQRPDDMLEQAAREAVQLAQQLEPGKDYWIERALRHIELTPPGRARLEQLANTLSPFWRQRDRTRELVEMALYATQLMVRDQHYVIDEDKLVLVDELTGRLANQRTLSLGLQQILEASQGIPISPPTAVSARLSFQRFFRLFARLGGMTGTAEEARNEFSRVYRLETLRVPTHRPVRREIWPTRLCDDENSKFTSIVASAVDLAKKGRSVLVGMRSVRSSDGLYRCFHQMCPDLEVAVLHAVNHRQEAEIIARAGRRGMLTIATNMAGRGTDIALEDSVREIGGLHVIIGEANDYRRIDRQLVGRCARQGDPGSVQRFIAFDDDLMRRFLPVFLRRLWRWLHERRPQWDERVTGALLSFAQWRAERIAFRQRESILKQDVELDRSGF